MGGLLAQAHPYAVLLGALGVDDGAVEDEHEKDHDHELDVGVVAEAAQQDGVLVEDVLDIDADAQGYEMLVGCGHLCEGPVAGGGAQALVEPVLVAGRELVVTVGVGRHGLGELVVAELEDVTGGVGDHHGDGVVLGYDAEEELDVLVGLCEGELLGGLRPDVHSFALLLGEVLDQ